MKRFTIIFSILLVLGFAGTLGYVGMSEDFIDPAEAAQTGEDISAPVWGMTMDDLLEYLVEEGFLPSKDDVYVMSSGVGTEGCGYDGAEFYWWDLDNLAEGSDEAAAYQNMLDGEPIDLWQQGTMFMTVTKNGPFALSYAYYNGDGKALLAAFEAFGQNGGGASADDRSAPVWSMTLDDLAAYLADEGVVDATDYVKINYGSDVTGCVGYRFSGLIDIVHYDLDNLDEASRAEYDGIVATGTQVYVNGQVGYFWVNGPFVLHFYEWGKTQVPEEEQPAIIEIFQAFGRE